MRLGNVDLNVHADKIDTISCYNRCYRKYVYKVRKKLDDALSRINEKTYGICRVCGILIAKERLLAVPITTLSASYKIRKECPVDGIDKIEARNI